MALIMLYSAVYSDFPLEFCIVWCSGCLPPMQTLYNKPDACMADARAASQVGTAVPSIKAALTDREFALITSVANVSL